jgi:hypothetical protein
MQVSVCDQNGNWESLYNFSSFASGLARIFPWSATEQVLQAERNENILRRLYAAIYSTHIAPFSRRQHGFESR